MAGVAELPPEIQEALQDRQVFSQAVLDQLATVLEEKLKKAVTDRKTKGIEATWTMAEESYCGIDEANRHEFNEGTWIKPLTINAPVQTTSRKGDPSENPKSTAFVRLTSRYVDAGAAKIGEVILSPTDKAFNIKPMPMEELVEGMKDTSPVLQEGQTLQRNAKPEEIQPGEQGANGLPPGRDLLTKDLAEEAITLRAKSAEKAETRIYSWLTRAGYTREMRKVIFDAARIGVGILKGPFPEKIRVMAVKKNKTDGRIGLIIEEKIVPTCRWVNPWFIYPDPACGEDLHSADYIFERDGLSPKQVRKLKGLPGYLDHEIDAVLEKGPDKTRIDSRAPNEKKNEDQFEAWYYYGRIPRSALEAGNAEAAKPIPADRKFVDAIVTMINGRPIKVVLQTLDSGEGIYHSVPWMRRTGYWAGIGVAEQVQMPQRMINAATRAMLNNAGVSGGPQIVIDQGAITPVNGQWYLTSGKLWYKSTEGTTDDVNKAFQTYDIPNVVDPMMKIINYALRLAEESTSIPLITQGQSGKTTPETFGATQLQNNNANQLLRSIGYSFDDHITEPFIHRCYEWLLLDPDVPEDEKQEFLIDAHGSSAMVERAIQDQTITQMFPELLANAGAFGINPKRLFAQLWKMRHLDPAEVQNTPEEQQKIDSQQPPPPPAVQVAMIKAQTAEKTLQAQATRGQEEDALVREIEQLDSQVKIEIETIRARTQELKSKLDTDRDTVYVEAETTKAQAVFSQKMEELRLKKELAIMQYANEHQVTMEGVKAKLAETAMKLKVEKELNAAALGADLHKHHTPSADKPPVQVAGKAPNGRAMAQA
ncbi:MAG: hypothetical protein Q7R68_10955 [Nitrospirales bacterium]|nr:hypothetical protein [Nitrospirales bacterium]